jgi:hypothetical protein
LLFFQPLNHFARRKIRDTAEFQCDDWAANHVGTGVHLAKCLAEVASWFERGRHDSPLAATMAEEGSPIVRRITRLLDDRRRRAQADRSVYGLALSLGLLGMVGWLAPRVSRAEAPGVAPVAQADQSRILANTFSADLHDRAVTFRDYRGEDGRARSQVRIGTPDEIVRVEVEHPRPPPPPPIPRRAAFELFIGGHVSPWSGSFEIQVHGLDQLHEDLEALFGTELEELEEAEPIAPSVFDI